MATLALLPKLVIFFIFIVNDNESATLPDYLTRCNFGLISELSTLFHPSRDYSESWLVATATPLPSSRAATLSVAGTWVFSLFSIQLMSSHLAS